ncbi:MAG: hypothetical protein JW909_10900 [Planctomycetes bacterium]|nr:hypothetical protein [Planctomycetota bacterium]
MTAKSPQSRTSGGSVFGAAARSKDFFDHLEAHYRECRRKKVDIDAAVSIMLPDGKVHDKGKAKVKDVSPTGALLADLKIKKSSFPSGPFTIEVKMLSGDYEGIVFRCQPVRFVPGENGLGVRFVEVYVDASQDKKKSR